MIRLKQLVPALARAALQLAVAVAVLLVFWNLVSRHTGFRQRVADFEPHCGPTLLALGLLVSILSAYFGNSWADRLTGNSCRAACFAASLLVFMLPVAADWTRFTTGYAFCGVMPVTDANGYWEGGRFFLIEGELNPWNCRRPLNALLLAVRSTLAGGSFQGAILLQAALAGLACYLLAGRVARRYGPGTGLTLFALLYLVAREHVQTSMSEALGLTLGALAAAILFQGVIDRRSGVVAAGMFTLVLGLVARAGAYFMVPALLIWVGLTFRESGRRFNWRAAGLSASAVLLAFLASASLRGIYGTGFGIGNGNFAHTLYGFSTGKPDWAQIYQDFPEVRNLEESGQNTFIYQKAWERICQEPMNLVSAYGSGLTAAVSGFRELVSILLSLPAAVCWMLLAVSLGAALHAQGLRRMLVLLALLDGPLLVALFGGSSSANQLIQFTATAAILLGMIRYFWVTRHDPMTRMVLAAAAGVLLSAPILYVDGGTRLFVVSYPLFFIPLALAPVGWRIEEEKTGDEAGTLRWEMPWGPVLLTAVLLIAAFIGPALARRVELARHDRPPESEDGSLIVRVGPATPHIQILPPDARGSTFVPQVRDKDFARFLATSPVLRDVHFEERPAGPASIVRAPGWTDRGLASFWLIGPPELVGRKERYLKVRGEPVSVGYFSFLRVTHFEPVGGP